VMERQGRRQTATGWPSRNENEKTDHKYCGMSTGGTLYQWLKTATPTLLCDMVWMCDVRYGIRKHLTKHTFSTHNLFYYASCSILLQWVYRSQVLTTIYTR
jgi:hypothetical protein